MCAPEGRDERILVLAPENPAAAAACRVLRDQGVALCVCRSVYDFSRELEAGAGAALIAEEAVLPPALRRLAQVVGRQPAWSDFPLLVLTTAAPDARTTLQRLRRLRSLGNVVLLEWPVRDGPLASAAAAALRARRRQYEARDCLARQADADRHRDQFLAMLGHELRNPLGAVRTAVEVLGRLGPRTPEVSAAQAVIDRQVRLLTRLVDDLLDISRVTAGRIELERGPVDLRDVARRCVQALEPAARAQRHEMSLTAADAVVVEGDAVRLDQVLTNLLTNAIKYTPAGGRITVAVERRGNEGVLRVCDNGQGVAPELLPHVFNLFTQAPGPIDRAPGGLGIGLTLVRSLAELHGGTAEASSDGPGRGSEFTVRLPLLKDAGGRRKQEATAARVHPAALRLEPAKHVLIVEDSPANRDTLQRLLTLWGHRVDTAEDGPRGVARALADHPEVILLDIGLPGLDGYEAARRIRAAAGERVFLIALTGYGQPEDRQRSLDAGFDAHLVKPVDPDALARLVARGVPDEAERALS
jgi:signal transduction histidine kinase/CheY-like chemotaxis protein